MTCPDDMQRRSVAFIAVGSNINPEQNIPAALIALMKKTWVGNSSTFYRTEPVGRAGQRHFVNGLWQIETDLSPVRIRDHVLRPIEAALGRMRTQDKYAPRVIDLDLVLYDDLVIDDGTLRLPHPDIVRPFVCVPILELLDADTTVAHELKSRMIRLLSVGTTRAQPGEVLGGLTARLRDLLSLQTH